MKPGVLIVVLFFAAASAFAQTVEMPEPVKEGLQQLNLDWFSIDETAAEIGAIIDRPLPPFASDRAKAVHLNKVGYRLYQQGRFLFACCYFIHATKTDPTYQYPFYNFACSVPNLIQGIPRYTYGLIQDYLEATVRLDPSYKKKMRTDEDLRAYRACPWFLILSGTDPFSKAGIREIIRAQDTWYGPKPGVYPSSPNIVFKGDRNAVIQTFNLDPEGRTSWSEESGTYEIFDGYVELRVGGTTYRAEVVSGEHKDFGFKVDGLTSLESWVFTWIYDESA